MVYNALFISFIGLLVAGVEGFRLVSRNAFDPFTLAIGLGIAAIGIYGFVKSLRAERNRAARNQMRGGPRDK
jgi:hypothetical protein